ncbi:hypothetical protein Cni_G06756 [Canna indica]|uniref:Uncharacterized protein n=1 Tax=Canna indica TaxID=4628 RepID=A0AAQ3Q6Q1_9LILI|nr:hypothetical protein Cni_G06756 [Canna indica]
MQNRGTNLKAKKHILVISRLQGLDCLVDARREHPSLLKKMHSAGAKWVDRFLREDSSLGYHLVCSPSNLELSTLSFNTSLPCHSVLLRSIVIVIKVPSMRQLEEQEALELF